LLIVSTAFSYLFFLFQYLGCIHIYKHWYKTQYMSV
jgi:hypothetical protein